ncbi:MAG: 4-(cytidine 5'-diphospho)-2-C-methyl-D-erythritol kinase [Clostridia bacterium]|nr:4-(cytidine 5'-diphospho)-2-C-methyl-D-erythritol kinase [Clostridia bacterium]
MNSVTEYAPCKVNLFLRVTGMRADGYHGIESVMTTLPLCDVLTVTKTGSGISSSFISSGALQADLESLAPDDNLAVKAAKLFFDFANIGCGVDIRIEKNIPSRAGLGGGSADAAAVLRSLNKMFSHPFTEDGLCSLGRHLGADVPFCVVGGTALCRGTGDEITKIDNKLTLHGIITSEKAEKKSTADAYRLVDESMCSSRSPEHGAVSMAKALEAGSFEGVFREAYNVFGEACKYPTEARDLLRSLGAPFVLMSGAGPSVVALTESESDAGRFGAELEKQGYNSFIF